MRQIDFNPNFITRMIPRIDWSVLRAAAENVSSQPNTADFYTSIKILNLATTFSWVMDKACQRVLPKSMNRKRIS